MKPLERLKARLAPLKSALLAHPVYGEIDRLEALHVFMQCHVFAVWDFMSLLKALQQRLTSTVVPWLPPADRQACRLVNEIVLAEESDEDGHGGFGSHFELYRHAMQQAGAEPHGIDCLLDALRERRSLEDALTLPEVPRCAAEFVKQTFGLLAGGDLPAIASAFTFGREDLLPAVFQRVVDELNAASQGGLEEFRYYLHRHIGLDGDEHGPMAHKLVTSLCGDDEGAWRRAEEAAVRCLEARGRLWDGILALVRG